MTMTIGIDLGTTNSCVSYHDGRQAHIIETVDGARTMPSMVSLKDGRILTGRSAQRELHLNTDYTFRSVKRIIGQRFDENETGGFQTVEGTNGEVWLQGPDRTYSPSEVSSYLIKAMLKAAEMKFGKRPTGAVITIPAGFNSRQEAATREAAIKAGLKVDKVHIMQEPAAAALAYGIDQSKFKTVAIYDLGGGTFDVAIMRCGKALNRSLALDGRSDLGGDDFDARIVEHVVRKWAEDGGPDLVSRPHCMARVEAAAEQAKIDLTTQEQTQIYIDNLTATGGDGVLSMNYTITRAEFIEMTQDLIDNTIEIARRAVAKAQVTVKDIDHVILVGGMTRIPEIRERVSSFFEREPLTEIVPEEAVARGAATRAAMIDKRIGGSRFINCASLSTGLRAENGAMTVVIPKGAELPFEKTIIATTALDDQAHCSIKVVQGEETEADANKVIVTEHVAVEPDDAGEPNVAVNIKLDEDGALSVMVDDRIIYDGSAPDDVSS